MRLALGSIFLILLLAVFSLWQNRFERDPEILPWSTADFQRHGELQPGVTWAEGAGARLLLESPDSFLRPVQIFPLWREPKENPLLIRYSLKADGLTVGPQVWDDGRLILEWRLPGESGPSEVDPVDSVRLSGQTGLKEVILVPAKGGMIPHLKAENLGSSGQMQILYLEVIALREGNLWKIGKWILVGAWLWWVMKFASFGPGNRIAPTIAGVVWIFAVTSLAIPGPWKPLHGLGSPFSIGQPQAQSDHSNHLAVGVAPFTNTGAGEPIAAEPGGKIQPSQNRLLQIKKMMPWARPMFHGGLLFAPTLLLIVTIGTGRALFLSALLVIAIEGSQALFGYGFDWIDVFDILSDSAGIALACFVAPQVQKIVMKFKLQQGSLSSAG